MENSLSPAFVRIDYSSAFGPHSMTIPSVPVIASVGADPVYTFDLRGAAIDVPVDDAVADFVDVLKAIFPTTVIFKGWTLFVQEDPEATPLPVQAGNLGIAGTNVSTSWSKAVQYTITWRTTEFGIYKLVLLDATSGNVFDKIEDLDGETELTAINDYVTDVVTWIAGRDGGRPNQFLQVAKTLNEKLRRSYRMN